MTEVTLTQVLTRVLMFAGIFSLMHSLIVFLAGYGKRKFIREKKFDEFRLKLFRNYRMHVPDFQGSTELSWLNRGKVNLTVLSGEYLLSEAPWLGFITREECVRIRGRYVWLEATHISSSRLSSSKGQSRALKRGEYVQGWQTEKGVYAVSDNMVSVIEKFAD